MKTDINTLALYEVLSVDEASGMSHQESIWNDLTIHPGSDISLHHCNCASGRLPSC